MDGNHDFYRIDDAMRDLPLGLGMAFMQNFSAFERFRELSEYERSGSSAEYATLRQEKKCATMFFL